MKHAGLTASWVVFLLLLWGGGFSCAGEATPPKDWRDERPPGWEQWDQAKRDEWEKGLEWVKHVVARRSEDANVGPDRTSKLLMFVEKAARKGADLKKLLEVALDALENNRDAYALAKEKLGLELKE